MKAPFSKSMIPLPACARATPGSRRPPRLSCLSSTCDLLPRSSRLITAADTYLALAKARQLPHASAGRIDIGADIDIDQIGPVCGNGAANGVADIAGTIDPHSLDAARARHRGKIRIIAAAGLWIVEVGSELAAAEIAAWKAADRCIGIVVPNEPNDRQIVFDCSTQHIGVHEEGAVAADGYARPIGCSKFRA